MRWFGPAGWGAPVCSRSPRVPVPVGRCCTHCGEDIGPLDQGVLVPCLGGQEPDIALHVDCQVRMVVGGLNHLHRRCTCCGGSLPPDPPSMSVREAASAASAEWARRQGRVVLSAQDGDAERD